MKIIRLSVNKTAQLSLAEYSAWQMSIVTLSDSERKILSGIIKVKFRCRSDHTFYFWVENDSEDESEGGYNSARGINLHLLHDVAGVGNTCTNCETHKKGCKSNLV